MAAATDRRNLRIFSVGGMQREIISLPGPVVALSGFGSKIMITIHIGMPLPGNQSIGVCVLNIGSNSSAEMASFAPLPLAPKSFLAWQGFTDEGTVSVSGHVPEMYLKTAFLAALYHGQRWVHSNFKLVMWK